MDIAEKLRTLEELFDVEEGTINEETVLEEMDQWDSMAVISLIAMYDEKFNKVITPKTIKEFKTISDIISYMD